MVTVLERDFLGYGATPPDPARDRAWIDSLRPIFAEFDAAVATS